MVVGEPEMSELVGIVALACDEPLGMVARLQIIGGDDFVVVFGSGGVSRFKSDSSILFLWRIRKSRCSSWLL